MKIQKPTENIKATVLEGMTLCHTGTEIETWLRLYEPDRTIRAVTRVDNVKMKNDTVVEEIMSGNPATGEVRAKLLKTVVHEIEVIKRSEKEAWTEWKDGKLCIKPARYLAFLSMHCRAIEEFLKGL